MILTIDVGLRNLAMCIMSADDKADISTYKIHHWEVYNTLDEDDYLCNNIQKNGEVCGKKCGYKYVENNKNGMVIHCCKLHFPKELLNNKNISKQYIFKKKAVNDYLLQDIAKIVLTKLQEIFDNNKELFIQVTQILIELQPKVNQKMKFTSHIIYGKLVELYYNTKTTVRFVRAAQKLKAYTGPIIECSLKGSYAKRKWLSIQYCIWFLTNKFSKEQNEKWVEHLNLSNKKDDMSDVALMAINGHYGIPKKQLTNKKGGCIK
jgi:hypothetical protein